MQMGSCQRGQNLANNVPLFCAISCECEKTSDIWTNGGEKSHPSWALEVLTFNHHTSGAPVQMNLVQSGAQTNCDVTNIQQHSAVIVFKQFLGYLPSYSGHSTISWLELHNTNTGHIKPVSYSGIISNYLDQLVSKKHNFTVNTTYCKSVIFTFLHYE